jgi:hypothetical protein
MARDPKATRPKVAYSQPYPLAIMTSGPAWPGVGDFELTLLSINDACGLTVQGWGISDSLSLVDHEGVAHYFGAGARPLRNDHQPGLGRPGVGHFRVTIPYPPGRLMG